MFVLTGVKCIMAPACRLIRMSDRRKKQIHMFDIDTRSTHLTRIIGMSRSLNSFIEYSKGDTKPSFIPWTPLQEQQHPKPHHEAR